MALLAFIISVFNSLILLAIVAYLVRTHVERQLGRTVFSTPAVSDMGPIPPLPAIPELNPLEGLKVGVSVRQDHEHPTFAGILAEKLRSQDAVVRLMTEDEAAALARDWGSMQDPPDVLVQGRLTCNGYTDVFYDSDFDCVCRAGRLTTIIERPAQGGRQFNLADTVIEKLRLELTESRARDERQRALGELK
jgi:hypothetical protein